MINPFTFWEKQKAFLEFLKDFHNYIPLALHSDVPNNTCTVQRNINFYFSPLLYWFIFLSTFIRKSSQEIRKNGRTLAAKWEGSLTLSLPATVVQPSVLDSRQLISVPRTWWNLHLLWGQLRKMKERFLLLPSL